MTVVDGDAVRLETSALRREVRSFLEAARAEGTFEPRCDGWAAGFSRPFSEALGARGWVGMTIPREFGGAGASFVERVVVAEELLAAGAPAAAHWVAERQMAPSILRHGSERVKREILPRIAAGTCGFSLGLSEPEAGSDLSAVRTRAERTASGWRIDGGKIWSSHAHRADYIAVLCRTEPGSQRHAGLSQIIVPTDAAGLTIRPISTLSDTEGDFCEVTLEGVEVDADMLLGEEGSGWTQITAELAFERNGPERYLSTAPLLFALARILGREAASDAQVAVGQLVAELVALRELCFDTAREVDERNVDVTRAAMAKDAGTEFEQRIPEVARRAMFSAGPAQRAEIKRLLDSAVLSAPTFTLRGGTTEILRTITAKQLRGTR